MATVEGGSGGGQNNGSIRRAKKGEILYRENDPIQIIYIVQSGKIALTVERAGKRLEVMVVGPGQVLGEQALFYSSRQTFTAEVLQEAKLMEASIDMVKSQMQASQAGVKLLLKSLVDESKQIRQTLRSIKMETDKSPCPQVAIPRVFALLNLVARHTGKSHPDNKNIVMVDWSTLKLYATRMFAESPQRMRGVLDLLKKLGHCDLKFEKSEEGEEELTQITLFNLQLIEDFAEFYQYNLYKGTYSEVIHLDPLALKVAKALLSLSEGAELDRKGAVFLNWDSLLEDMKKKFSMELKNIHLDALEKKGLFVKRQSRENAPALLSFERSEFTKMANFWSIIDELDKWNEKGFVDLHEKELTAGTSESGCPQCHGVIDSIHKFCPHCGYKLKSEAA